MTAHVLSNPCVHCGFTLSAHVDGYCPTKCSEGLKYEESRKTEEPIRAFATPCRNGALLGHGDLGCLAAYFTREAAESGVDFLDNLWRRPCGPHRVVELREVEVEGE